jgi:hypothetical protein
MNQTTSISTKLSTWGRPTPACDVGVDDKKSAANADRMARVEAPPFTTAGTDDGDLPTRLFIVLQTVADRVTAVQEQLRRLEEALHGDEPEPTALTVAAAAALCNRSEFTVREWCRHGRIQCERASSGRGPYAEYRIPMEAIRHYQSHGLLPLVNSPLTKRVTRSQETS